MAVACWRLQTTKASNKNEIINKRATRVSLPSVPPLVFFNTVTWLHTKGGLAVVAKPTQPPRVSFFPFVLCRERERDAQPHGGSGWWCAGELFVCPHNPPYKWRLQHHNGRESTIVSSAARLPRAALNFFFFVFQFERCVERGSVYYSKSKTPGPPSALCVCVCAQCVSDTHTQYLSVSVHTCRSESIV